MKQGAHEVTENVDQVFGQQLPTVDFAQGVERYFEFVQKAVDVNRELATNWADAVNSFSGVVREQTEKVRELTTEQADKVESATREQVDKVEQAEKTPGPPAPASHQRSHRPAQRRAQRAFDRHQVDRHRTTTPVPAASAAGHRRRCRCLTQSRVSLPAGGRLRGAVPLDVHIDRERRAGKPSPWR